MYCKRGHLKTEDTIVRNKYGHIKDCKLCVRERSKEWYRANKDRANAYSRDKYYKIKDKHLTACRTRELKKKYNLTRCEYDQLFLTQSNMCANQGCGVKINTSNSHIDHCHATGKVRGLLCKKCNWALGLLKDDVNKIFGLGVYLINS